MAKKEEKFVLTAAHIQNAKAYIPLDEKCDLAKEIAKRCVVISEDEGESVLEILSLPIKKEDIALKQLCLMNVLVTAYLNLPVKNPFTQKEFDYYAGSHLMNQIERFKGNYDLKDKIYDMICDYKEFKKIVDTEIYNEKSTYNDSVSRVIRILATFSKKEDIDKLKEAVAELKAQTEAEINAEKGEVNG